MKIILQTVSHGSSWDCIIAAVEYAKENRTVESKTYDVLQQQVWALLPGFCNKTVDIVQSFPGIAKILGSAITDRPDLRQEVMASVRKLINQNLDHGESCGNCAFHELFLPNST